MNVVANYDEENDSILPNGWEEAVDSNSGRMYYINSVSNITQWERPKPYQWSELGVKDMAVDIVDTIV